MTMFETIYKGVTPEGFDPFLKHDVVKLALHYFPELTTVEGAKNKWVLQFPNGKIALLRAWTPNDNVNSRDLSQYSKRDDDYGQSYQINMIKGVGVAIIVY